jgi:hypothetical protein
VEQSIELRGVEEREVGRTSLEAREDVGPSRGLEEGRATADVARGEEVLALWQIEPPECRGGHAPEVHVAIEPAGLREPASEQAPDARALVEDAREQSQPRERPEHGLRVGRTLREEAHATVSRRRHAGEHRRQRAGRVPEDPIEVRAVGERARTLGQPRELGGAEGIDEHDEHALGHSADSASVEPLGLAVARPSCFLHALVSS